MTTYIPQGANLSVQIANLTPLDRMGLSSHMNSHTHGSSARAGAWLGRVWRRCLRQEARIACWLIERGISRVIVVTTLWTVKLTAFAILLYVAFWIAVALAVLLISAAIIRRSDEDGQPKWLDKDPDDHREDLFYHPLPYTDEPDTRYYKPHVDDE